MNKENATSVYERPTWDDYFLEVANAISRRATCDRGRSGAVIVQDNHMVATGYVGSPPGLPHCDEVGHLLKTVVHEDGTKSEHCMRTVHAEENAILQAAKKGRALEGGTIYCRMTPCRKCAMDIISVGIKRVVCERKYHKGDESEELFKMVGIELVFKYNEMQVYE